MVYRQEDNRARENGWFIAAYQWRILEVGCSCGNNLLILPRYGKVYSIEIDKTARGHAPRRKTKTIPQENFPRLSRFPDLALILC
jgi:hypothetical protein